VWKGLSSIYVIVNIYLFCLSFVPILWYESSLASSFHFEKFGFLLNHFFEFLNLVSNYICSHNLFTRSFKDYWLNYNLSSDIKVLSISLTAELFTVFFEFFFYDILNGLGKFTSTSLVYLLLWHICFLF
jgi:hypothetical protein